jgi:uncharacterized protein
MLAACLSAVMVSCRYGTENAESPKKIEVTGSAEMEIVPDEISMIFTLKEYLDAAKMKVKLESIKNDFLKLCKDAGVADSNISISSYSGSEPWDYSWYKKRKTEPDFKSSISYAVKVSSPEKLDKIVSGMNENAIDNFYLGKISHSKIEQLRKEVKIQALIATRNKAEYLAESIGEKLGEALLIEEIENSYGGYYANEYSNAVSQRAMSYDDNSNSSKPDFQKIKLRYEMKAEYKLK